LVSRNRLKARSILCLVFIFLVQPAQSVRGIGKQGRFFPFGCFITGSGFAYRSEGAAIDRHGSLRIVIEQDVAQSLSKFRSKHAVMVVVWIFVRQFFGDHECFLEWLDSLCGTIETLFLDLSRFLNGSERSVQVSGIAKRHGNGNTL
jgi:hypothetical protein